jgi:hypothetical protein
MGTTGNMKDESLKAKYFLRSVLLESKMGLGYFSSVGVNREIECRGVDVDSQGKGFFSALPVFETSMADINVFLQLAEPQSEVCPGTKKKRNKKAKKQQEDLGALTNTVRKGEGGALSHSFAVFFWKISCKHLESKRKRLWSPCHHATDPDELVAAFRRSLMNGNNITYSAVSQIVDENYVYEFNPNNSS